MASRRCIVPSWSCSVTLKIAKNGNLGNSCRVNKITLSINLAFILLIGGGGYWFYSRENSNVYNLSISYQMDYMNSVFGTMVEIEREMLTAWKASGEEKIEDSDAIQEVLKKNEDRFQDIRESLDSTEKWIKRINSPPSGKEPLFQATMKLYVTYTALVELMTHTKGNYVNHSLRFINLTKDFAEQQKIVEALLPPRDTIRH